MTRYVGFAVADSMFKGDCLVSRRVINAEMVGELIDEEIVSCVNITSINYKSSGAAFWDCFGCS